MVQTVPRGTKEKIMKIYVGHSNEWNCQEEIYEPIMKSNLYNKHQFIFPHMQQTSLNTDKVIEECDLFIAEMDNPSLGLGTEMERAEKMDKQIVCIYMMGYDCPNGIKYVNTDIIQYKDSDDMIRKLGEYIEYLEKE